MHSAQLTKSKINQVKSAEEALLITIKSITKEDIAALTTDFFLKNPDIVSISWTQYTPYFNDGEPCIFRVHAKYFAVWCRLGVPESWYGTKTVGSDDLRDDLQAIPDKVFLELFGDHVEVTISNLGEVSTMEYNHD